MLYVHCGKRNSKFFSMLLTVLQSVFSPNINRTSHVLSFTFTHLSTFGCSTPRPVHLLMLTIVLTPLGVAHIHVISSTIGPSRVGIRELTLSLKHCVLIFILTLRRLTSYTYVYIYIYIYITYRPANLQTLHFIYLVNKYTY
jgi:hypothetical protein